MPLNLETLKLNCAIGSYGHIGSPHVELLIEAVQALQAERSAPNYFMASADHYELNEVECICGFVSESENYEYAEKALRDHLSYHQRKAAKRLQAIKERADKAISAFDFGTA